MGVGVKSWEWYILETMAQVPLATPMVLWQLHSTVLVLANDYEDLGICLLLIIQPVVLGFEEFYVKGDKTNTTLQLFFEKKTIY